MSALVRERPSFTRYVHRDFRPLAAGVKVWKGGYVIGITSGSSRGYYKQGDATSTAVAVGFFAADADNSSGADGAISAEVVFFEPRHLACVNNDAGTPCTVGDRESACYLTDDQTVTTITTTVLAGRIYDVGAEGVWVDGGKSTPSSGNSGGGATTVTTGTALALLAGSSAGSIAYLSARKRFFLYDPNGTAATDNVSVFSANGVGQWVAIPMGSKDYRTQAVWYVDPVSGSDDAAGTSSGTAIKTGLELRARWGNSPRLSASGGTITINLLSTMPATDCFDFDNATGDGLLSITMQGTVTAGRTGTFDTFTAGVPGSNMPNNWAQAAHADWSSDKANRVKDTTQGSIAWCYGGSPIGNTPFGGVFSIPAAGFQTITHPANGDAYQIDVLPRCTIAGLLRATGAQASGTGLSLTLKDLDIGYDASAPFQLVLGPGCVMYLMGCKFRQLFEPQCTGNAFAMNCLFFGGLNTKNIFIHYIGCTVGLASAATLVVCADGTSATFEGSCNLYNTFGLNVAGGASVTVSWLEAWKTNANAFTNPAGHAVFCGGYINQLPGGGRIAFLKDAAGNGVIFGGGSATWGANAGLGLFLPEDSFGKGDAGGTYTCTGTLGDLGVGQTALSLVSIDPVTNAPRAAINQTWANWLAPTGSGGFGGNIRNAANYAALLAA